MLASHAADHRGHDRTGLSLGQAEVHPTFRGFAAGGHKIVSSAATPRLFCGCATAIRSMKILRLIALADNPPVAPSRCYRRPCRSASITWSIEVVDATRRYAHRRRMVLAEHVGEDVREGYSVQDMALWAQEGR